MADAGMPVKMQAAKPIVYNCRPDTLKRAVRNLLDNTIFAEMNRTTMSAAGTSFVCCIIACVQFGP
jgi:hypothetical protein